VCVCVCVCVCVFVCVSYTTFIIIMYNGNNDIKIFNEKIKIDIKW
jgi:hypothetical protein